MISYTVDMEGLHEQLAKFAKYPQITDARLKTAMTKSVIAVESAIVPNVPVGVSSRLRNSIASEVVHEGPLSIIGKVGSTLKGEEYPMVMEFGRRPGATMPPPQALERWVHLQLGVSVEEAPRVAFLVARAIGRRGIKGREFMKKGWEKSQGAITGYFNEALNLIAIDLENGRK